MNDLKRKIMLMQQSIRKSRLPSEYQQVTYIKNTLNSNGLIQAYVNTGYIATSTNIILKTGVRIYKPTIANTVDSTFISGNRISQDSNDYIGIGANSKSSIFYLYTKNNSITDTSSRWEGLEWERYYNLIANFNGDEKTKVLTVNNIDASIGTFNTTNIKKYPFSIFNTYSNGYLVTGYEFELYYFKLYDNGELKINMIPCYRKADNVIGVYDLQRERFFTSSNNYTFLKGRDVQY